MPQSPKSLYLSYLDRDHLSDPFFLRGLAGALGRAGSQAAPCMLVHGSGERAERLLEGVGQFVERAAEVLAVRDETGRQLVEQAVRKTNQQVVSILTDAVVAAVPLAGTSRGLLRLDDDGRLRVGPVAWVIEMAEKHVVPVVCGLATDGGGRVREVAASALMVGLARALGSTGRYAPQVVCFTRTDLPGVQDGAHTCEHLHLDHPHVVRDVPDLESLRPVVGAGIPVRATNSRHLIPQTEPGGTLLVR